MTEQEQLKKSIDNIVEKILETDKPTDQKIAKAGSEFPTKDGEISSGSPEGVSANGGKDRIKNDSPMTEEEKLMEEKKKKEAEAKKSEEEKADADKVSKAKDCDDDKDEDDKDKKKDEMKKKKMKKSLEALSEHLDDEELELIKAWREQPAEAATEQTETVAKSTTAAPEADKGEDLKKALSELIAPLQKAMEDKDSLIKSLGEKIEKMASQPAYDRRSISSLEALEKSGEQSQTISKSNVTDKLLALQLAGKGVNSHHIAEFEATGNISDPAVKAMVFKELKLN